MALSVHAQLSRPMRTTQAGRARGVAAFMGQPVMPRPQLAAVVAPAGHRHSAARAPVLRATRSSSSYSSAVLVEANLFSRLVRVVKAYVTNFTEQWEDPELLLDRVTDEMQEDLIKMRQATAKVMASEKQMATKFTAAQNTADEWLRRAELAVRKGQDELAREALMRRKTFDQAAASLKIQLDAQRKALDQLQANVRVLEGKLGEARNKRETLKARAASAKSSKQIQEMVAGLRLNNTNAWAAFDKMEEKVMSMEAEAESAGLLATPDAIEAQFARLEGTGTVEDELALLKQGRLAATTASSNRQQEMAAVGRPINEVLVGTRDAVRQLEGIDAELEQLRKRARGQ